MTETRPHAPRAPRVRNGQVRAIKRKYLLADPLNWHTHPPEQRRALAAVFAEIGFVGHLLVRPAPGQRNRWYIVDGHERAEHFGPEDLVPCCVLDVAEAEARKLLKAYDPIGYLSGVDREILAKLSAEASFEAEGLEEAIAATLERQGRDEWWPGAAKVPQDDVPAPETDKAAALARKWKAAPGQVWMCRAASGRAHRVTIADNSSAEGPFDLVCSDPPYDLSPDALSAAVERLSERAILVGGARQLYGLPAHGWRVSLDLVWIFDQSRSVLSISRPIMHHTLCSGFVRGGAKLGWQRPTSDFRSVIRFSAGAYELGASGQAKSPKLFCQLLAGFKGAATVADPFLGTGGTLIAGELCGKTVSGWEIDPQIAAVGLQRAADFGLVCECVSR